MTRSTQIVKAEARWRRTVSGAYQRRDDSAALMSVCGPSGAGKTTVVQGLQQCCGVYVECATGNPHLQQLLNGAEDFDAAANQEWFLERVSEDLSRRDPRSPLALDQDPAAIVLAYARMFFDEGRMSEQEYVGLLTHLLEMEGVMRKWTTPRTVLCLDAPAAVLHERVQARSGRKQTPPIEWFSRLRDYFLEFFDQLPNAIRVSTVDHSLVDVVNQAKALLEARNKP